MTVGGGDRRQEWQVGDVWQEWRRGGGGVLGGGGDLNTAVLWRAADPCIRSEGRQRERIEE